MKKRFPFIICTLVAALMSSSCLREVLQETETQKLTFRASFAETTQTRTALQSDGISVWWTPQDSIDVFYGGRLRGEFVSNNTQLQPVVSFSGSFSSFFGGIETGIGATTSRYFAIYPSRSTNLPFMGTEGQCGVTLTVEDVQRGFAESFGRGLFPSVAVSNNLDLAFYNVCGGARFSVVHEGIKAVVFKANGGESIAGRIVVEVGPDGVPDDLTVLSGKSEVTVIAPEGGFVPGVHYFAAFLPCTLSKGLSMTFKTEEKSATFITEKSIRVNRSRFGILDGKDDGLVFMNMGYEVSRLGSYTEGIINSFTMSINPVDNLPYFAYTRTVGDENCNVSVAKWTGTGFALVGSTGFADASSVSASKPQVAFAKDGTMYAKYLGGDVAGRPTVKRLDSDWVLVGAAGFTPVNNNTSYHYPFFVHPSNSKLFYFWNGNNKTWESYRTMNLSTWEGDSWVSSTVSGVIPAYGSGESTASGMYYTSYAAQTDSKAYICTSLNQFGYYVHEVNADGSLTTIVDNYLPEGAPGLPSNLQLKTGKDGALFLFAPNPGSEGSMQVYSVDRAGKTLKAYGAGIPIIIGPTGSISVGGAFGISPLNGLVVSVIDSRDECPVFKFLDGNLRWCDFDVKGSVPISKNGGLSLEFDRTGKGYVAYLSDNGIELFTLCPVTQP